MIQTNHKIPIDRVRRALDYLPPEYRVLIELVIHQIAVGEPIDLVQIAAELKRPDAALYSELAKAMVLLKSALRSDTSQSIEEVRKADGGASDSTTLRVCVEPGNASKDTIQEVLESLNDLHWAHGGIGFNFRTDGPNVTAEEDDEK